MKLLSDEVLVEKVRKEDQELYREVVMRYQDKLLRYAHFLLHNREEAIDVVQEAFIKAFVNLNSFDKSKKFSSWIYRIVHNECINQIKKRRNHVSLEENNWVSDMEDKKADVVEKFTRKETEEILKRCLEKLPLNYKEALMFFYLEDRSYDEISDILRVPTGTVGTNINRGKKMMKEVCKEYEE